jgi:hypothetical protein
MPFDPKIRRSPSPPLVKPASTQPAAAPQTNVPVGRNASVGHATGSTFDSGARQPLALTTPSVARAFNGPARGVNDESIGVNDESIGVNDESIGVNDESIGVNDESIGVNDESIGVNDESIGGLGPERDAEAIRYAKYWDVLAENPDFLRPNRDLEPVFLGKPNLAKTEKTLSSLPLTTQQREGLMRSVQKDQSVAYRMDVVVAGTAAMDSSSRASLMGLVAEDPQGVKARIVEHLVYSPTWATLDRSAQGQMAKVFQAGGEQGMRFLSALSETRPQWLQAKGKDGQTVLANLAKMATQPLNAGLYASGLGRERLVQDVLRDLANPDRVDQGNAPTCTVTGMMYELVHTDPGEYTKLMAGLTGPSGRAAMRGGGELALQKGYVVPTGADTRSCSEVLFQSAAMEYANGADAFNESKGVSTRAPGTAGASYRGLWPSQQTALLTQLFAVPYATEKLRNPEQATKALTELRGYDTRSGNRPVILELDMGTFNHAVTYEFMKEGRVFFRDPYGAERSMPEAAFLKHVSTVHLPASLRS